MSFDFEPIKHKDLKFLQNNLDKARSDITKSKKEQKLSAVLSFVNHAEYITRDLLRNLRRMTKITMYQNFERSFFWPVDEEKGLKSISLGKAISKLEEFSFPDKKEFIELLKKLNKKRIKLIHKMLDEPMIINDLSDKIQDDFENIFVRYRAIQDAMREKWPYIKALPPKK